MNDSAHERFELGLLRTEDLDLLQRTAGNQFVGQLIAGAFPTEAGGEGERKTGIGPEVAEPRNSPRPARPVLPAVALALAAAVLWLALSGRLPLP